MLSFELSVIDIVLVIAVIILLLLQITRPAPKYAAKPELPREKRELLEEEPPKKTVTPKASKKKESSLTRSQEDVQKCPHHFGYLKTLPLGGSVPEECYNCSRMMQCLFSKNE